MICIYVRLYTARGQGAPITIGVPLPSETARSAASISRPSASLQLNLLFTFAYLFVRHAQPDRQTTYEFSIFGPIPINIGEQTDWLTDWIYKLCQKTKPNFGSTTNNMKYLKTLLWTFNNTAIQTCDYITLTSKLLLRKNYNGVPRRRKEHRWRFQGVVMDGAKVLFFVSMVLNRSKSAELVIRAKFRHSILLIHHHAAVLEFTRVEWLKVLDVTMNNRLSCDRTRVEWLTVMSKSSGQRRQSVVEPLPAVLGFTRIEWLKVLDVTMNNRLSCDRYIADVLVINRVQTTLIRSANSLRARNTIKRHQDRVRGGGWSQAVLRGTMQLGTATQLQRVAIESRAFYSERWGLDGRIVDSPTFDHIISIVDCESPINGK